MSEGRFTIPGLDSKQHKADNYEICRGDAEASRLGNGTVGEHSGAKQNLRRGWDEI
jgi:hypothetical protein